MIGWFSFTVHPGHRSQAGVDVVAAMVRTDTGWLGNSGVWKILQLDDEVKHWWIEWGYVLTCFCVFLRLYHSHTHHCSWRSLSLHINPQQISSVAACSENSITNAKTHGIYRFSSECFLAKHINFGVCLVQYLLGFPLKILFFSKTRLWSISMVTITPKFVGLFHLINWISEITPVATITS